METTKESIINEYMKTKQFIVADYQHKEILAREEKNRQETVFRTAKLHFENRRKVAFNCYMQKRNTAAVKMNNEKAFADEKDRIAMLKIENEYSITLEGFKKELNEKLDNADDSLYDAHIVWFDACNKLNHTLRELGMKRDSALNRAKEIMQEALEALAKEGNAEETSDGYIQHFDND